MLLINHRSMLNDLAAASLQNEIAFGIKGKIFSAVKSNPDLARVSAGSQTKVIFKLTLLAVIDQINPRINSGVPHLSKRRDVGVPSRSIISDQVVGFALQRLKTFELWSWVSALEFHPHNATQA